MVSSFSIIIPAYNEEDNISNAYKNVVKACRSVKSDYEIILVDDGSVDKTGKIMEDLSKKDRHVKVLHNERNRGFGYAFGRGIGKARKEYIGGFPGDNDMSGESLKRLMNEAGKADIIISYMINPQARSIGRRIASKSYIILMNMLFGLNLRYYNGHFICRRKLLKNIDIQSDGIAVLAEIKVLLLKKKASYKEIPFEHNPRIHGVSKILTYKGITQAAGNTFSLYKRVNFS